ncbi:MAG: hypothetical protein RXQ94_09255 [Caldivirga sp.]
MTTEAQDTPGTNKTNPHEVVQGLLGKLGLQEQPQANAVVNGSDSTVFPEAQSRQFAHPEPQPLPHAEAQLHAENEPEPQLPAELAEALRRGSVEVNCRPCGGCCGRRRGLRVGVVEYLALVYLRGVLGYRSFCDVLRDSRFNGLFCSRRGHGGVGRLLNMLKVFKEVLRVGSREGAYSASYLLKRVYDGVPYYDFADVLIKKVAASLASDLLRRGLRSGVVLSVSVEGLFNEADAMLSFFARELGFSGLSEFAQYMHLTVLNLAEPRYANRHAGYKDILSVSCKLCGAEFNATEPVLRVLWDLTWHFKHAHGLRTVGDVETKVKELRLRESNRPEGDDAGLKLLRHSAEVAQLVRLVVHRLMDVGLLERLGREYRCRVCNADVGGAVDALVHALNHHYDVVNRLLGGRPAPSVDGFNDVVDELASLLNSGNPNGVKPVVKALARAILDVLSVRGSISMLMLTRELSESEDYRPLINSLTTGSLRPDRVVAVIIEAMARYGLVHVDGGVVRLGD